MQEQISKLLKDRPIILQFGKFAAIGFLTAALDFLILNFLSKVFGINAGYQLGLLNIISFIAAVLHNYVWQRHWTFALGQDTGLWRNFIRCALVGGSGVLFVGATILSARFEAPAVVFGGLLVLFFLLLWAFWNNFQLLATQSLGRVPVQFAAFAFVSIIGLLINTFIVSLASSYLADYGIAEDLAKNIAKVAANAISLVWNFTGYKLIVFKR